MRLQKSNYNHEESFTRLKKRIKGFGYFSFKRNFASEMGVFAEYISTFQLFLKGLIIGIIASAPMGPVGILCIQRTLQKGRSYGIVTGAGMSFVIDFVDNERNVFWLKLVGSVMLFIFGIWTFLSDPRKSFRPVSHNKGTLLHNFITSFFVTVSNPLIIFLFLASFNMLTFVVPNNVFGSIVGYLSILAGAMIWWWGLTYVIVKMRKNFGLHGIKRLNHTIGSIVVIISIAYAIMTLLHLSLY